MVRWPIVQPAEDGMSETIDLTLLSGSLQALEQEVRLLRAQYDQLAGTTSAQLDGIDARLGSMEVRLGVTGQSIHDLDGELARAMGQLQQQFVRREKRFDVLDAGLATLRREAAENTYRIVRAITRASAMP
jgi:hypothetical protein